MKKPIIICVDDEKFVLDSLRDQLKSYFSDLHIEVAESGEDSLEILKEHLQQGSEVALVISDQIMPGMKGDELLRNFHKLSPRTRTILLTGQASFEAVVNAINNSNLYRYISKPWEAQDLRLTTKEAVNSYFQELSLEEKNKLLEEANDNLKKTNEKLKEEIVIFNRFVPDKFLQLLNLSETDDHIKLGECAELTLTVMFSDIRSFTSLSEKLTLKEVFSFINSYTGRIGPIITKYNGFIDKYIGDSIMALFLSPDDAVQASIHMLNELDSYNKHRKASGYAPIAIGIGLNTGKVMMGTVGEVERIQTTVVGDAVNLAARIEHLTKVYRTPILITENVYKSLKDLSKYALKLIDKVNIIGKDEVVTVFEVLDSLPQELKNKKLQIKNIYEEACEFYAEKKYEEACNLFTKCVELCPEDVASNNYLKLCADILKT